MKKLLKWVGIVLAIPLLGFVGLLTYGWLKLVFFSLPTGGPRVIETPDYTLEAGEGWLTHCAEAAPGCLAVSVPEFMPTWDERIEWIEVAPVDAVGVTDSASFGQRAKDTQLALIRDRAAANLVATSDGPGLVEGTQFYELTNLTHADYLRSAFVRLPGGSILRFTCNAPDATHDFACAHALARIHFPAAEKAWAERVAREAEERKRAEEAEAQRIAAEDAARKAAAAKAQEAWDNLVVPTVPAGSMRQFWQTLQNDPELRAMYEDWE